MARGLTLDTGALVALETKNTNSPQSRRVRAVIRAAQERGALVTVPSPVIIEWWRGQRGPAARLLDEFETPGLERTDAEEAGLALVGVTGPSPTDAAVMAGAAKRRDNVLTADYEDMRKLRDRHFKHVVVLRIDKADGSAG